MEITRSKMFDDVKKMNTAFGNWEGHPLDFIQRQSDDDLVPRYDEKAWARLFRQCHNIGGQMNEDGKPGCITGEVEELLHALAKRDVDKIRDALCDIMVFALGAYHFLGYDADRDMSTVVNAVMTRFCKDGMDLAETCAKYAKLGVQVYTEGEFPTVCVKSALDQTSNTGEVFPKGKFLKSVSFKEPMLYKYVIPPAPAQVPLSTEVRDLPTKTTAEVEQERRQSAFKEMEQMRKKTQEEMNLKKKAIERQLETYRSKLEREAFGLPPYDASKNSSGEDALLEPPAIKTPAVAYLGVGA